MTTAAPTSPSPSLQPPRRIALFGLQFDAMTLASAVDAVVEAVMRREPGRQGLVITPNVDLLVTANRRAEVQEVFRSARFLFADGMPVVWISRLIPGKSLPARVSGPDLLTALCERAAADGLSVAFVGGMPGVAQKAGEAMRRRHPALQVVATHCPPFGFEKDERHTQDIIDLCRAQRPDILFLGVGSPKQELWSHTHLAHLDVGMVLCIGAALDFAAGTLKRAPRWMQRSGLEWFWRMTQDPKRLIRRYLLRDVAFLPIALREILSAPWSRQRREP